MQLVPLQPHLLVKNLENKPVHCTELTSHRCDPIKLADFSNAVDYDSAFQSDADSKLPLRITGDEKMNNKIHGIPSVSYADYTFHNSFKPVSGKCLSCSKILEAQERFNNREINKISNQASEDNNQSTENTNDDSLTDSEYDSFYSDLPH